MCFGGGGGGGGAAPTMNFTQPISKQIEPPQPVARTFKSLVDETGSANVRLGARKKKTVTGTPLRQSLSSGVSIASTANYPSGGVNL